MPRSHEIENLVPKPSPRENFFRFVNHQWLQETSIPPSESRWGTFTILRDQTTEQLRGICEEARDAIDAPKGTAAQLVGDFYRSGIDVEARNRQGLDPLKGLISEIGQTTNHQEVVRTIAMLQLNGLSPFFRSYVTKDCKNPDMNILYLGQAGLGMPDREYYLADDASMKEKREKYQAYVVKMFELSGYEKDAAQDAASSVLRIEHELAQASLPQEDAREIDKNYHEFTVSKAKEAFPQIDWDRYFQKLGIPDIEHFVIKQPNFIARVSTVLEQADLKDIKNYLTFSLLNGAGGVLSEDFVAEHFGFHGQTIQGLQEQKPVWKQALEELQSGILTHAIGPLYIDRHFSPEAKTQVTSMVANIKESFRQRVGTLGWMTDETKKLSLQKLDNITAKMGYPDAWTDISRIDIQEDAYVQNCLNIVAFTMNRKLQQVNKPVDKNDWSMPPTLVNACADQMRAITFPAAILQPPFFDASADEAYNYGAIGVVIAHELTHFFDDQGCKFNSKGVLEEWWSEEDKGAFSQRAELFVEHFGAYVVDSVQTNGRLTLGENIADIGGVAIAFDAYKQHLKEQGTSGAIDGLTPEQRFFVAYARVWAGKARREELQRLSTTDPHAPGEVRTNGVLSLNPEFIKAFGIQEGDRMYTPPEKRPVLW